MLTSNILQPKGFIIEKKTKKYNIQDNETIHRLYFTKEHVLGTQICEILGIATANISNLKSPNILKVGSCPILSKYDLDITKKIRNTMFHPDITSLEDKMVLNHFKVEYGMNEKEILSSIADKIETIAGKRFICFTQEFLSKIKQPNNIDNLIYVCDYTEFNELLFEGIVKYYYKLNDKKFLVIY